MWDGCESFMTSKGTAVVGSLLDFWRLGIGYQVSLGYGRRY